MERKIYIDYLKVIGLLLVIMAHVSPPLIINQLRSFDVPLLVLISGYLAATSYKEGDIKNYLYKRFKRLVFPAWIFICIFLPVRIISYNRPTIGEVLREITFQRDSDMLGFLWVIWVYLVCACLVPLLKKIPLKRISILIMVLILFLYELLSKTDLVNNRFLYNTFFTIVPYGLISFIGLNIEKINKILYLIIACLLLYIIYALYLYLLNGYYIQTDYYKYAAQIYYLSFALSISLILYCLFNKKNITQKKLITFISSSSLWIYLWHILSLYAVKKFITNDELWYIQYILILILAIIITYVQNYIVDAIMSHGKNKWLKIFKG